ncbi:hypothetical protein HDV00_004473 [Rhizophlyctis rosea]|nr:hypothetical protein HDV00_004473 [Rhizophlyctis rosea]
MITVLTGGEPSTTWRFEHKFNNARDELHLFLKGKVEKTMRSKTFGPVESRWRISIYFRPKNGRKEAAVSIQCTAVKSSKELKMGSKWSRVVNVLEISLVHQALKDLSKRAETTKVLKGGGEDLGTGWKFSMAEFEEYLSPEGSLTVKVKVEWESAPSYVERPAFSFPFNYLLFNKLLADVTLRVRDPSSTDQGTDLPAHKVVLASRSEYFRAVFSSSLTGSTTTTPTDKPTPTTPITLDLTEFPLPTINSLLEFMYCNYLTQHQPTDLTSRLDLIRAADYYQMEDLHLLAANQIIEKDLNMLTAMRIGSWANMYRGVCGVLADKVKEYVAARWDEFMRSEEFRGTVKEFGAEVVCDMYE